MAESHEQDSGRAVRVFISYSHKDENLLTDLKTHLSLLQREGAIELWHDREISAGTEWADQIGDRLSTADLVLLLVSPDFLDSEYCWGVEVKQAMERHEAGEARVIPIVLRPVEWERAPFGRLQALPKDARAVTEWRNRDAAWKNVTQGLRKAVDELRGEAPGGPSQRPAEGLLRTYYRGLAADCRRLPLGVIDTKFVVTSGKQPIRLPDIYVDLDVVAPAHQGQDNERSWALRLARGEGSERTALLETLTTPAATRAVLLGDGGSGKTTFVNYLTSLLASSDRALPDAWHGLLPVRLALRDVAARSSPAEASRGTAQMLWEALARDIAGYLGEDGAAKLFPYLQSRLLSQGGFILLDGLDEVPEALCPRATLLDAVQELANELKDTSSHMLVTARPYAYAPKQSRLEDFAILALAPFDEKHVERFLDRWYAAARPFMGWSKETAHAKGVGLRAAIKERAYLADLASRPLLLVLMATLHSSWGQLPHDRASLYEESVKLLLGRWQRARETRAADRELVGEPGITQALGVGEDPLRAALEHLAYSAHEGQGRQKEHDEGPADIGEGQVLVAFKPLLGPLKPDTLLAYFRDRTGLLLALREDVYAFPHRSFQEYLAACHLANTEPDFAVRLRNLVWEDPVWWREVFLLGVGKKRQGGLGDAINVINILVPQAPDDVRPVTDTHWRAAALAGQALLDLQLSAEVSQAPYCSALIERVRRWLVRLILTAGGELTARERAAAGDVLGRLGDPRPGVVAEQSEDGPRPEILWVEIPAGAFTMGSQEDEEQEDEEKPHASEQPAHELTLPAYYISRYPITNAQYALFLDDRGYENQSLWLREGWAWRQGELADLAIDEDPQLRQSFATWLAHRSAEQRNRPFWWEDTQRTVPTRPVVGVCWYEALAYCRWVQAQLTAQDRPFKVWRGGDLAALPVAHYIVRLPSEAEWEKAARGPQGRRWPWGNEWQAGLANTLGASLSSTSPVGAFPGGTSPYELLDMAGNVWEWTRSRFGKRFSSPDYAYPYVAGDGREKLDGPDLRVVRGGSWGYGRNDARCARRGRLPPSYCNADLGFRVVVSLSDPGL